MSWQTVYSFWFETLTAKQWFSVSQEVDDAIKQQFETTLLAAKQGELHHWRETAKGALCEIIVLDQFSRNIYRDLPDAFSQDPQALVLAQWAIARGFNKQLSEEEVGFMYLPFMHSESKQIHEVAEQLYRGHPNYDFEVAHKNIIDRFGRYPHRNEILGRVSSEQELTFLTHPNSSF
ncbi:DUF924 family protein [Pseudoalteromonas sp. G4]|uniref:DUF924 family protein n=1 Tax=Pseudoalteromonas sp. G4 TaxID=2992761 RepID=UPI00237E8D9E|nr:DUF924 family protein [Pseudoalteromonas sp. G4]MDE3270725.1 DUF924 domain-containing protein [Pseudoalteromonas sp. G4]